MHSLFTTDALSRLFPLPKTYSWAARPPRVVILGIEMFRVHPRMDQTMR
jgi:hypothetical protein